MTKDWREILTEAMDNAIEQGASINEIKVEAEEKISKLKTMYPSKWDSGVRRW